MSTIAPRRALLLGCAVLALVACDDADTTGPTDDTSTIGDTSGDDTVPPDTDEDLADDDATDVADTGGDTAHGDTTGADGDVGSGDDTADTDTSRDVDSGDTSGDSPDDLDTTEPTGEAIFVAQGHVGRTTLSCDDGRSWTHDRAFDTDGDAAVCDQVEPVVCYDESFGGCQYTDGDVCQAPAAQCDCDHHPGAGQGVAYGGGVFVSTWGWGPPGSVRRSHDGATWEVVLEGTTFGGVAHGNGTFVLGDRQPRISTDGGATWTDGGPADLQSPAGDTVWNVRALGFADVHGGRFVITGESGEARDVLVSADDGASWTRPTTLPASCAAGIRGIAGGNDTLVLTHRDGTVCHSADGGVTFAEASIGQDLTSPVLFDGTRFITWARGAAWTSTDGASWTSQATTPDDLQLGAVAWSADTGTYVAVRGGWQVWYDAQRFYRSVDGVTWETLDTASHTGSHVIRDIAAGRVASCP